MSSGRFSTPVASRASAVPRRLHQASSRLTSPLQASQSPAVARTRGRRVVRKRGVLERLLALPESILANLLEDIQLYDIRPLGYPTGIALNALHALVKFSVWLPSARRLRFWQRSAEAQVNIRVGYGWSWILSLLLIGLSVANAVFLFSKRRKYELWLRKTQDPLGSPNAKAVNADLFAPTRTPQQVVLDWLKSFFVAPKPTELGQVTQLSIWTPEEFNMRVFSLYSPIVALLWHLLSTEAALPYLLAGGCVTWQLWYLITIYSQTLKDRLLLHSEVAQEYQEKFVRPRLFAYKRDASTQTSQAEMVHLYHESDELDDADLSSRRRSSSAMDDRRRSRVF